MPAGKDVIEGKRPKLNINSHIKQQTRRGPGNLALFIDVKKSLSKVYLHILSQVHEGHPECDDDEPCDELDVRAAQLRLLADAPRALGLGHALAGVPVRADAGLYLVLVR